MPALTKEQFLTAIEAKREKVPLPEMGPDAYILLESLDATGLINLQAKFGTKGGNSDQAEFAARLLQKCIIDDEGTRLFQTNGHEPEQEAADAEVSRMFRGKGYLLAKLSEVAMRLSGLPTVVEELEKN